VIARPPGAGARRAVVVPCHNEAARLDVPALRTLVDAHTALVLVDDGSTDDTRAKLTSLRSAALHDDPHARVDVVELNENAGKGEAVRAGLLHAIHAGAQVVGYLDADLAAPPREMTRLLDTLTHDDTLRAALGSRVALLGTHIERRALRHYLGRVFATAAALTLDLAVYDTQCGAKAFRVDDALRTALATPFSSRWVFDVELLARLLHEGGPDGIIEVPLEQWRDVRGGALHTRAMVGAGVDLARIFARRLRG
jgi:dolichyl-phosphate beta-glucosyltransferase